MTDPASNASGSDNSESKPSNSKAEFDFSLDDPNSESPDRTHLFPENHDERDQASTGFELPLGSLIGRYRIDAKLGKGGFGVVYQASDTKLGRNVALKLAIRTQRPSKRRNDTSLLDEARASAKLDHPNVVRVFDADEWNNRVYVVMELVRGGSLSHEIEVRNAMSIERVLQISHEVAAALEHLHLHGIIHRDLKPSNILLSQSGEVKVTDLGLALTDESPYWRHNHVAGTHRYMSPEQVLGEVHRIDGRTDIWGFGVVLYEMLTFQLPFRETDKVDVFHSILKGEVPSPRQRRPDIPESLERLCLKCLSPRMASRFQSAAELRAALERVERDCQSKPLPPFANDSRTTHTGQPNQRTTDQPSGARSDTKPDSVPADTRPLSDTGSASKTGVEHTKGVVPKGLRPFDARDNQVYIRLMPGPYDLNGLPAILSAWKDWVENDTEAAEPVGVLYGPSGCGKSSFALAALIPSLNPSIKPVYCNLTVSDPIGGILAKLQQVCDLPEDLKSLPEALSKIRDQQWPYKVLLVLDQFEQYLAEGEIDFAHPIIQALRQCDGQAVQAILLVRDEFWCEISAVMHMLERPLAENSNTSALPLMSPSHARRVLESFGRAYETIPPGPLSDSQRTFLDKAIRGMARENQILCVNLAMFAELMRHHAWDTATLQRLGGTQGVLTRFLSDSFDSARAPISHRPIRNTCAEILRELIPNDDRELKATAQPVSALAAASNESLTSVRFKQALQCLDQELHLVMRHQVHGHAEPHYSLTHDFLVHPVKSWLSERDAESWRGRAKTRLIQAATRFQRDPKTPHLLSITEWLAASWAVPRRLRSDLQRKVMAKSGARAMRWGGLLAVLMLGASLGIHLLIESEKIKQESKKTTNRALFDGFITAESNKLAAIWKEMRRQENYDGKLMQQLSIAKEKAGVGSPTELFRGDLLSALAGNPPSIERIFQCLVHSDRYEFQMWQEALNSQLRRDELITKWSKLSHSDMPAGLRELQWLFLTHNDFRLGPDFPAATDPMVALYQVLAVADGSPEEQLERVAKQCWEHGKGDTLQARYEKLLCIHLLTMLDRPRNAIGESLASFLQEHATSTDRALALSCQSLQSHLNQARFYAAPREANNEWSLERPVPEYPFTMVRIPTREFSFNEISRQGDELPTGFKTNVKLSGNTWLACDEVATGLFDAFVAERSGNASLVASGILADSPMTIVDAVEIFQFCNWLSDRAGLENSYSIGTDTKTPYGDSETSVLVLAEDDENGEVRWHNHANGYRLASHYEILAASVHGDPDQYWQTIGCHSAFQNRLGPNLIRLGPIPGWQQFPNAWGIRGLMCGLGDLIIDRDEKVAAIPTTINSRYYWTMAVQYNREDNRALGLRLARGPVRLDADVELVTPLQTTNAPVFPKSLYDAGGPE